MTTEQGDEGEQRGESRTGQESKQCGEPRQRQSGRRRLGRGRAWRVLALAAVVCVSAGFWASTDDDLFELRKNFEIFGAAYKTLASTYVEDPEPAALMQAGIDAMLSELDPYTVYMNETDVAGMRLQQQRGYGGIGLELGRRGGEVTVLAPHGGTAAYQQGVKTGDVLLKVDQTDTDDLTLEDVHSLLRGQPGTTVPVTIRRPGVEEPLEFRLTRAERSRQAVSYKGTLDREAGLGYVRLDRFDRDAGDEVRSAVETLQAEGALNGLILDLRNNPGGLLEEAVEIAGLFVEQGQTVVTMRGRTESSIRSYRTSQAPLAPDVPVVVLVNDYSASASEIVAGALQDLDRGVILGDTTYGKGLVQTVETLPYNTAIKVTVARYYTPSGRCIQAVNYEGEGEQAKPRLFHTAGGRQVYDGRGIAPDITARAGSESPLLQALRRQAAFFLFASNYSAQHASLPDDFQITEGVLSEFRTWLDEQDFAYTTSAEEKLQALQSDTEAAGYALDQEIGALAEALRSAKRSDFADEEARIKAGLREAILTRYVSESERIHSTLDHDPVVQQGLTLLRDDASYRAVLR